MQKNHAKRTALALFLLFAVTVSAQAAKIAEVTPIGHTVGIKMQAEGVLIVQLTEVQGADGTLTTQDGDPQMILEDVGSRVVRTISYTAEFDGEAREMCLYYTTKVGEDYSADRRVFPQSLGSGQYVYTLPRTSLAALRLDPCSPEENKAVTLTMSDITLNAADTLPAVWQYFVPTWHQAFCLVLYPALAAAAVSMVGAVAVERKRK